MASLYRSPSIYDEQDKKGDVMMSSYLSGKLCPLTPSQQQTDVTHLAVQKELKETLEKKATNSGENNTAADCSSEKQEERALVPKSDINDKAFCSIM